MKNERKVLKEIEDQKYQKIATFEKIVIQLYKLEHHIENLDLMHIMPITELKAIFIERYESMLNESDTEYLDKL
jgi:hypothetical protein|tara:strand:- start:72 stop:293 length:222 start_codon:yes stop_codon:yes gene_type:complete